MKNLLFILFTLFAIDVYSQSISSRDSILLDMQEQIWDIQKKMEPRFKLIPTENIYTLLRLNTSTGQVDLLQWHLDRDKEFINSINTENLSLYRNPFSGNFELYPTKNMYQFILIDTRDGRCWHVQWGSKISERWIKRIY